MKTKNQARLAKSFLLCLTVLIVAAWLPTSAFASTAATATIRNTVYVDYEDSNGNTMPQESDTADVTVNLVAATPTLNAPVDGNTDPATAEVYTYTISSNANGLDTYNLSVDNIAESAGFDAATSTAILSAPSIDLGGSTVAEDVNIPAATATDVIVPSDSAGADGAINGIAALDTIIIGGNVFTVNSITDNGGVGTSTINVTGATATNATAGDLIGEQGTFDLTVTPGTLNTGGVQTITVDISAEDSGAVEAAATDQTITTVTAASLAVTKVADVANAAPGDTITYTITVTNSGSSDATAVTLTDAVPQFTSYTANSTLLNGITVNGDGATSPLAGGLSIDDDGARGAGVVATGIIQPGNSAVVTFEVTVN